MTNRANGALRIALSVHHHLDANSGAAGASMALADALREEGHEVDLFSHDMLPRWLRALPGAVGLRSAALGFPFWLAGRLSQRLSDYDVLDLLSGDGWIVFPLAATFSTADRRPLLVTHSAGLEHVNHEALRHLGSASHNRKNLKSGLIRFFDAVCYDPARLGAVKGSHRSADLCLFLNRHDRDYAVDAFGLPSSHALLTRNGLPDSLIGLEPPRPGRNGLVTIAQIGRYIESKGVRQGASALGEVMRRHPGVVVRFLGTGIAREEVLRDFSAELHDRIEVVARFERNDLPRLLAGCEIKLFPSLSEGFGMALLEAMACGLAPVAAAVPGPLELIEPEVDGLLVPAREASGLGAALMRLIEDEALRQRLRRNAHRKAQAFAWAGIARHRVQLYRSYLANQASRCGSALEEGV